MGNWPLALQFDVELAALGASPARLPSRDNPTGGGPFPATGYFFLVREAAMASFLRARATSFRRFRRRLISFVRSLAMAVSVRKPGKARNAI